MPNRDVTSLHLWGVPEAFPCENFVCDLFLVTVVGQMVLNPVAPLQKYILLQFLSCEMANFQGWGVGSPSIPPLNFTPSAKGLFSGGETKEI